MIGLETNTSVARGVLFFTILIVIFILFLFGNVHRSLQPVQFTQIILGGDVSAERTLNYEAGLRLTPLEGWEASFTYFRFDFDNQIVSVVEDGITKFRNLGEARHQGLET